MSALFRALCAALVVTLSGAAFAAGPPPYVSPPDVSAFQRVTRVNVPSSSTIASASDALGVGHMEAVVVNPLDSVAYPAGTPVETKVEFAKGEVPTADYLMVSVGGSNVPFQWEGATDPRSDADESLWSDGSLRAGSIWINLPNTLAGGAKMTESLTINQAAQGQSFTPNVVYSVVTANSVYRLATTNQKFDFEVAQAYQLRRIYDQSLSSEDYFTGQNGVSVQTYINGVAKNSFTSADVTVSSFGERAATSAAFGGGVVFRDWETVLNWNAETGLYTRTRYRVWANGSVNVSAYSYTTAALASNARRLLLIVPLQSTNTPVATSDANNAVASVVYPNKRIMVGLQLLQYLYEATPAGSATTLVSYGTTSTFGWGPNTTALPSGAYFTQEAFIAPRYTSGDEANEFLRRRNPVGSRFTRYSVAELRGQIAKLAVTWAAKFNDWYPTSGDNQWLGCEAVTQIAYGRAAGVDNFDKAVALWNAWLAARGPSGLDGSAAAYQALWNSSTGIGLEYIGRNTQALNAIYDEAVRTGRPTGTWVKLINNYADFMVAAEAQSGGDGSVRLYGYSGGIGDNWNAEASALNHLAKALSIAPNATYQATFNRIWARFSAGYEAANFTAYQKSAGGSAINLTVSQPTFHYFSFQSYESLAAMKILPGAITSYGMHPRVYIYKATNALGQIKERQNQYLPERRGVWGTQVYAAAALALQPDANASDLEQALALYRHLARQALPVSFSLSPLDGWSYSSGMVYQAMDARTMLDAVSQ